MAGKTYIGRLEGKVGEEIAFRLVEQGSAGYLWQAHFDARFLELVEDKLVERTGTKPGSDQPIGGPSRREFRFRLKAHGETDLEFKHIRPWQPDTPADTQSYQVKISRHLRVVGP